MVMFYLDSKIVQFIMYPDKWKTSNLEDKSSRSFVFNRYFIRNNK